MKRELLYSITPLTFGMVFFVIANVYSYLHIACLADNGIWLEEKNSKSCFLSSVTQPIDFVFIGSSKTQNHINSLYLKKHGVACFNLGLAGRPLRDQYYSLVNAAAHAKKAVILSINGDDLTYDITFPELPTLQDFPFFLFNFPFTYRDITFERFLKSLPINRYDTFLDIYYESRNKLQPMRRMLDTYFNFEKIEDNREILYIRGSIKQNSEKRRYVVVYKNGDATVFSKRISPDTRTKIIDIPKESFNDSIIEYLSLLSDIVTQNGLQFILNIAPDKADESCDVDIAALQYRLPNALVIDTQCIKEAKYWADEEHLNYDGILLYNDELIRQLSFIFHFQ